MPHAFIFVFLQDGTVFSLEMMRLRIRGCDLPKFTQLLVMVDFDLKSDFRGLFRETIRNPEFYMTNELVSPTNQFPERKKGKGLLQNTRDLK